MSFAHSMENDASSNGRTLARQQRVDKPCREIDESHDQIVTQGRRPASQITKANDQPRIAIMYFSRNSIDSTGLFRVLIESKNVTFLQLEATE
jgi:hypothetical protein